LAQTAALAADFLIQARHEQTPCVKELLIKSAARRLRRLMTDSHHLLNRLEKRC
jgi:hypothetical protein